MQRLDLLEAGDVVDGLAVANENEMHCDEERVSCRTWKGKGRWDASWSCVRSGRALVVFARGQCGSV